MAKNVFEKKKRVARFQSVYQDNSIDGESVLPGCHDYVSSIIKNMDSSFQTLQSNNFSFIEPKKNAKNMFMPSTSEERAQNTNNMIKSKKISLARKFPLMEKSQKILKQLKHNQRIPKQRAHLATLPNSPLKKNAVLSKSGVSNQKRSKHKQNTKKTKTSHNNYLNSPSSIDEDSVLSNSEKSKVSCNKVTEFNMNKSNKSRNNNLNYSGLSVEDAILKSSKNSKAPCKKVDEFNLGKGYKDSSSVEKESLNTNVVNDNMNDTTDSDEYERFVQNNKKGLKKRMNQKTSKCKTKVLRKSSKKVKKIVQTLSDTDSSDDTSSHIIHKRNKKQKVSSENANKIKSSTLVNDESESYVMNEDIYSRDTSSESDSGPVNNSYDSQFVREKNDCCLPISESCSIPDKNKFTTDINSSISDKLPNMFSENVKNYQSDSITCYEKINMSSDRSMIIDEVATNDNCENVTANELSASSTLEKKENCVTTNITQNTAIFDPEESDIEIIEIVVPPSGKKGNKCKTIDDSTNCSNEFIANYFKNENSENIKIMNVSSLQSLVAPEPEPEPEPEPAPEPAPEPEPAPVPNTQIHLKTESVNQKKSEAVYSTDICKESDCKSYLPKQDQTINKIIKTEDSDDDIIILDSFEAPTKPMNKKLPGSASNLSLPQEKITEVKTELPDILIDYVSDNVKSVDSFKASSSNNSYQHSNLSDLEIKVKNPIIKNEDCFKNVVSVGKAENTILNEKELKLYEVACSNMTLTKNISGKNVDKVIPTFQLQEPNVPIKEVNTVNLLELFKKEFQTYQEILQTEANVEASLKLLETNQADKLKYIRSLILKGIKRSTQSKDESINSKIIEDIDKQYKIQESYNSETFDKKPHLIMTGSSNIVSANLNNSLSQTIQNITGIPHTIAPKLCTSAQSILLPSTGSSLEGKPDLSCFSNPPKSVQIHHSLVKPKLEPLSVQESSNTSEKIAMKLLGEKCNVCGKEAMAACQRCAKVFFCSNECGKKFWIDGHENECSK